MAVILSSAFLISRGRFIIKSYNAHGGSLTSIAGNRTRTPQKRKTKKKKLEMAQALLYSAPIRLATTWG
jgi:hypothetical protein